MASLVAIEKKREPNKDIENLYTIIKNKIAGALKKGLRLSS